MQTHIVQTLVKDYVLLPDGPQSLHHIRASETGVSGDKDSRRIHCPLSFLEWLYGCVKRRKVSCKQSKLKKIEQSKCQQ